MHWMTVAVLAAVQGATEFLPVSSSGHLVIGGAVLSGTNGTAIADQVELNIVLHVGTLASVLVVYWRRVWRLLGEDRRVVGLLVVGTLPAVVVGLPLKELAPDLLASPLLAGAMLLLTGGILIWGGQQPAGGLDYSGINHRQAFLIGMAQAAALLPGLSRSGVTIVCGMSLGLKREAAATFSFLLAIPAIAGGSLLELLDSSAPTSAGGPSWQLLLLGAVVAFAVGLFALRWLLHWLHQGQIQRFAYWCFLLGGATLIWQLATR